MINNWIEKGHGLIELIEASGHWIRHTKAGTLCSDDVVVTAIASGYTAAMAAEYRIARELDRHAAALRDQITQGTSPAEMASWPMKLLQAQQFSGADASAPLIAAEAAARGVTTAELVQRVLTNAAYLNAAEAQIAGTRGKHADALKALGIAGDFEAVLSYDITAGWLQ